jgi:hypothetical protein
VSRCYPLFISSPELHCPIDDFAYTAPSRQPAFASRASATEPSMIMTVVNPMVALMAPEAF